MSELVEKEIKRHWDAIWTPEANVASHQDATYVAQWTWMTHMLNIMDLAMRYAGLHLGTRREVIRAVLLGAPNEAEATQRIEERRATVEMIKWTPPKPMTFRNGPPVT